MSTHPLLDEFDAFLAAVMAEWQVPGCAVAVVQDSEVVHVSGYGLRDVAHHLPVTENTLFAIGSCTKAFTAACLGLLVDEGRLDWDTPLRAYLPDFRLFDPVATERLTPRDLLCHRSGLPGHNVLWYATAYTREDLFGRLRYLEPNTAFRSTWQYNNLLYMTAGVLVERVAGCPWEDFVRRRLFAPLGMRTSNLSVGASQHAADCARPYRGWDAQLQEIPFHNMDAIGPAGSINSSARELVPWLRLQLNGGAYGGQQLLAGATLWEMHTPQMALPPGPPAEPEVCYPSYGLGWFLGTYRGHRVVQHGGGIDGFAARVTLLPEERAGLAILTNREAPETGELVAVLASYYLQDRLLGLAPVDWAARQRERQAQGQTPPTGSMAPAPRVPPAPDIPPTHPLADYAGAYTHPGYGTLTIRLQGAELVAAYGRVEVRLAHRGGDTFELAVEGLGLRQPLQFHRDADGAGAALSAGLEPAGRPIEFRRVGG